MTKTGPRRQQSGCEDRHIPCERGSRVPLASLPAAMRATVRSAHAAERVVRILPGHLCTHRNSGMTSPPAASPWPVVPGRGDQWNCSGAAHVLARCQGAGDRHRSSRPPAAWSRLCLPSAWPSSRLRRVRHGLRVTASRPHRGRPLSSSRGDALDVLLAPVQLGSRTSGLRYATIRTGQGMSNAAGCSSTLGTGRGRRRSD